MAPAYCFHDSASRPPTKRLAGRWYSCANFIKHIGGISHGSINASNREYTGECRWIAGAEALAVEELKKGYCCLFELDGRGMLLLDIGLRIWDANQLEQWTLELVLLRWGKKTAKDA
jgi:hypothetical protein